MSTVMNLLHPVLAAAGAYLAVVASVPSAILRSLHTYVHPDSLSSGEQLRSRSPSGDDPAAQLIRLRLADPLLRSRPFFRLYNLAALLSILALANLLLPLPNDATALFLTAAAALLLLLGLAVSSLYPSTLAVALLSSVFLHLFSSVIDFKIQSFDGFIKLSTCLTAGVVAGLLLAPAGKMVKAFWIGTDQLEWGLEPIACSKFTRFIFYANFIISVFSSVGQLRPIVGDWNMSVTLPSWYCLVLWAITQLLLLRPCLQMWLNESVVDWYRRLQSTRSPDLEGSRVKMFLHNRDVCLSALQLLAPPVLVLLLVGVAEVVCGLDGCSQDVKEVPGFIAWWSVFVWCLFTSAGLALYRVGWLYI